MFLKVTGVLEMAFKYFVMSWLNMQCELCLKFLIKPAENNFAWRHQFASLANQAPVIFHNRQKRYPKKQGCSGRSANSH